MTALEQFGAFVATHQPDQRARAEVRLHTADTIGAWIAACGTAEGRALLAFRKDADGLADRVGSTSFVAALDDEQREPLLARVRALAADGPLDVPYVCELHVWRPGLT